MCTPFPINKKHELFVLNLGQGDSINPDTSLQDIKKIPPNVYTEHAQLSVNHSTQEIDLEDIKTNSTKLYFEKTKSMLQRLPTIAKEIANAVVSDIDTDVTSNLPEGEPVTFQLLTILFTKLKKLTYRHARGDHMRGIEFLETSPESEWGQFEV
ncbi:Forkhead-associated (FHA) domain [Cinara cedri]|uniref:Forkhead-associated (FHA) domain n=1 Tax=Cinara cedri TaxID=506608 RepID=A0A5E4NEL3_9HEMI|nr:Forkhead-associated (FHA) domain [Cinara cedri]